MNLQFAMYLGIPCGLWLASILGYTVAYPTPLTPISLPSVMLAFRSPYLAGSLPAFGFLATAWPELLGKPFAVSVFLTAVAIVGVLAAVWFAYGWKYGLRFQGAGYVWCFAGLNLLVFLALLYAGGDFLDAPRGAAGLALHLGLWAWVGWFAFPYLGEWP